MIPAISTLTRSAVVALVTAGAACMPGPDFETESPDGEPAESGLATAGPMVRTAVAEVRPASGSDVRGTVRLEALDDGGVAVTAAFTGLEPGAHAYHVHQFGDCSRDDASSAGPHYPFDRPATVDTDETITGNLGEVTAGESGEAESSVRLPEAELNGSRSLIGRAIVVHRRGNDPEAAPTGDTGARVACGTIGIVSTLGSETTRSD